LQPSAILKWLENLPCFRRLCLLLGRSPSETFRVEVVGKLAAEFQKMENQRLRLERPVMRIYGLLLRPPIGRV
jgi:hypothetical protein